MLQQHGQAAGTNAVQVLRLQHHRNTSLVVPVANCKRLLDTVATRTLLSSRSPLQQSLDCSCSCSQPTTGYLCSPIRFGIIATRAVSALILFGILNIIVLSCFSALIATPGPVLLPILQWLDSSQEQDSRCNDTSFSRSVNSLHLYWVRFLTLRALAGGGWLIRSITSVPPLLVASSAPAACTQLLPPTELLTALHHAPAVVNMLLYLTLAQLQQLLLRHWQTLTMTEGLLRAA